MKHKTLFMSFVIAALIISGIRSLWYTDILVSSILTNSNLAYLFGTCSKTFLFWISLPVMFLSGLGLLLINMYMLYWNKNKEHVNVTFNYSFISFSITTFSSLILMKLIEEFSIGNMGLITLLFIYHVFLLTASIGFYMFSIITLYNFKKHIIFIKVKRLRNRSEWKEDV